MVWSFSAERSFERCPRQWFYRQVVAHHAAKDPTRREAYLLSKLDSLWSWRGRLVDDVITRHVVPALGAGRDPDLVTLLRTARRAYEAQLAFATANRLREPGMRPSQHPDFLALHEVELGMPPTEDELERAWRDIETALTNLLTMDALFERLKHAALLLPQYALSFRRKLPDDTFITVRAVPDLVAFFEGGPPLIIDWKVHTHAAANYREQLAGYAFALIRSRGQRGLPSLERFRATDVGLLEAQLLRSELRSYQLTEGDVKDIEASMVESAMAMRGVLMDHKRGDRNPYSVPTTTNLKTCDACSFKAPCWQGSTHLVYKEPGVM